MALFALRFSDLQLVGFDERRVMGAVPVSDGLIMLGGLVLPAMFEADERVFAEWHQIRQQKAVSGLDFIVVVFRFLRVASAGGVAGERERHVLAAPIIAAAAPFFGAGALGLRALAVIKEKSRVAFQG